MKIMSRDFTRTEKILLLVLFIILLGLVYYWLVDQTVRNNIRISEAEAKALQIELDAAEQKLELLDTVQKAMDDLTQTGNLSYMGSYNNSKEEVGFLNDALADATKYSISFADVTRRGDQIRRNFTLQFTTKDYDAAHDIMTRISSGTNRCLISDVKCSISSEGKVTINALATFYETMEGGTPDAGLPEDQGASGRL